MSQSLTSPTSNIHLIRCYLVDLRRNLSEICPLDTQYKNRMQTCRAPSEVRFKRWPGPNVNQLKQMVLRAELRG